jgi:hypothetical protein
MTALNSLVITEVDIAEHQNDAQDYLRTARQRVSLAGRSGGTFVGSQSATDEVSLLALVTAIDPKDELLSDEQLHTLRAIRRGLQMGFHMAEQFRQRSGAFSFESAHGLSDGQKAELNEKMQTAAAIAVFATARFILWDMKGLTENNTFVGNIPTDFEKVDISSPRSAVMCLVYYLGKHVEKEVNGSDDRLVAAVIGFAQAAEQAILNRQTGLKHTDAFTSVSYTLEETDFSISGFELIDFMGASSMEFNRVEMADIVGNADAKHFAKRLVMRILCYNVLAQKNVFSELGGLVPVWMGYGKPGTGKSMLIAAVATMLQDYCDRLGIPFLFNPLPDNIVDSYQGNSAKNMVAWMKASQDPTRIVFMPVDDAENILEERTRKGVSEGVRAAIGVFLRYTEGAYAVNRGNATIGVFTNLPEQIDAAVRSRIQGRMVIDGADTVEDFLDQDYIWFRKFADQEGFNNLTGPEAYEYMSAQRELKTMADAGQTRDEPEHVTVAEIFTAARAEYEIHHHEFFANLYMKFMGRFNTFSSRDVRNIQSAVNQRIMDFDLPEEWFETPEAFTQKTYDEQKSMVIELRNVSMNGLSLAEIYLQEAVRYLDNYATIADGQFDRDVEAQLEQVRVRDAVQKRAAAAA